ncbi:MAG: hypothetical protein H6671_05815 [Anaerolineaceae bacterium]|nr:hypothetical protein [Anaerolineaceae bacterium]
MASRKVGRIAGLEVTAAPSVPLWGLALWVVLAGVGLFVLRFPVLEAVLGGLAAAALHFVGEFIHQYGHSYAASATGYPMIGVRYWTLLAMSIYPRNEPELPAAVHIRRALGGPAFSILVGAVAGIITLLLGSGGVLWWLLAFFAFDNFFVFGLGAFLPLGFTDGSTLLYWWGKR